MKGKDVFAQVYGTFRVFTMVPLTFFVNWYDSLPCTRFVVHLVLVVRYIVDPQNEGVLLPVKGDNANKHQTKYKVSSHVHAFLKQFAQGSAKKQKSFDAAGPWQVL